MTALRRILIVDDEPDTTEIYKLLFELNGYKAVTAGNGVEALDALNHAEPEIILSDCMMPKMDGLEFVRRLRQIPAFATTPVILMSGAPELHDFSNKLHTTFLKKPVLFERVLQEINRILDQCSP